MRTVGVTGQMAIRVLLYICYLISAVNVFLVKELRNIHTFI